MNLPTPTAALALVPTAGPPALDAARAPTTRETAEEFEAIFLAQMISHMFTGIGSGGMFGGGPTEETYRAMLHQELGKTLAKAGGVGIADSVMRHVLSYQEVQTP